MHMFLGSSCVYCCVCLSVLAFLEAVVVVRIYKDLIVGL